MTGYTDEPIGTLTAPILPRTWPTTTPEQAAARNKWCMDQQRIQFKKDPTVRFMKCVDNETGEILSLARWHYYKDGYKPEEYLHLEVDGNAPKGDWSGKGLPEGMNKKLHAGVLAFLLLNRKNYCGKDPFWSTSSPPSHRGVDCDR